MIYNECRWGLITPVMLFIRQGDEKIREIWSGNLQWPVYIPFKWLNPWNILWVTHILILQSFRQQRQGNDWLQNSPHRKKLGKKVSFLLLDAKDNHQNQEKYIFYGVFAFSLNIPPSKTAWNTTQWRIIVMMTLKLKNLRFHMSNRYLSRN